MVVANKTTMKKNAILAAPGRNLCKTKPVRIMTAPTNTIKQIGAPLGRSSQNELMVSSQSGLRMKKIENYSIIIYVSQIRCTLLNPMIITTNSNVNIAFTAEPENKPPWLSW